VVDLEITVEIDHKIVRIQVQGIYLTNTVSLITKELSKDNHLVILEQVDKEVIAQLPSHRLRSLLLSLQNSLQFKVEADLLRTSRNQELLVEDLLKVL
jgi:hypothetical protein